MNIIHEVHADEQRQMDDLDAYLRHYNNLVTRDRVPPVTQPVGVEPPRTDTPPPQLESTSESYCGGCECSSTFDKVYQILEIHEKKLLVLENCIQALSNSVEDDSGDEGDNDSEKGTESGDDSMDSGDEEGVGKPPRKRARWNKPVSGGQNNFKTGKGVYHPAYSIPYKKRGYFGKK